MSLRKRAAAVILFVGGGAALAAAGVAAAVLLSRHSEPPAAVIPARCPPLPTRALPPPPAPSGLLVGISPGAVTEHLGRAELARQFRSMRAAGVQAVRLDVFWPDAESTGGHFDFCAFDEEMVQARRAGLGVLMVLDYPVRWSHAHAHDFAEFGRRTALHYAPLGIHDFELWNEPNLGYNWWGKQADPADYAAVVRAGADAIRSADRSARIVVGALANAPDGSGDMAPARFLSGMYAAGVRGSFDAVSCHPYSFPFEPGTGNGWSLLAAVRAVMNAHADRSPVWITEYGAPTGSGGVSETEQARELTAAFTKARSLPWVRALYVFDWEDNSYAPGFGILDAGGTPKPGLSALERAAARP